MAKTKLNQVVAVVSGQKSELEKALTEVYHAFQKPDLFSGLARTYTPKSDDGDTKPPERKAPQKSVKDLYKGVEPALVKALDSVATQDWGNTGAFADVEVDGVVLVEKAPVPYLLFLEHKLQDLKTFVEKMPTRDGAEQWDFNADANAYVSPPVRRESTKKVNKPIVLYQATDKHPAQTQLVQEDVVVGNWDEKKFSTAVSAQEKEYMLARVVKLAEAVKRAREEANSIVVEKKEVAKQVLGFVFGDFVK
jgi:hypothetical protein